MAPLLSFQLHITFEKWRHGLSYKDLTAIERNGLA